MTDSLEHHPLILVTGIGRSGTTWLGKIFDSHPAILYRNEPESELPLGRVPKHVFESNAHHFRQSLLEYLPKLSEMRSANVAGIPPFFRKSDESTFTFQRRKCAFFASRYLNRVIETLPFHNFYLLGHDHFNATIRHEALQRDFEHAMKTAGVDDVVKVPVVNRLNDKRSVDDAYDSVARRHAIKMFGPFMSEWGYEFSSSWESLLTDADHQKMIANARLYRRVEYLADSLSRRFNLSPNGSGSTVQRARNVMRRVLG